MSEAPEQIGLVEGLPGRWRLWTREDDGSHQDHAVRYVRADRLEAQEALLREAVAVLEDRDGGTHDDDCKVSRPVNGMCNCGHEEARATLAKLRAHFDGEKE